MEYFDVLNKWGEFTGEVIARDICHKEGLWHKAVVIFVVSSDNQRILLQQRSSTKKLNPNCWDITAGGHVLTGELGIDAVIRETKEEIGLDISKDELTFIGSTTSENIQGDIINRHYNEYYVVHKDIDINTLTLQSDEVQDIRWFSYEEFKELVDTNSKTLADKRGCFLYLLKYFEIVS